MARSPIQLKKEQSGWRLKVTGRGTGGQNMKKWGVGNIGAGALRLVETSWLEETFALECLSFN